MDSVMSEVHNTVSITALKRSLDGKSSDEVNDARLLSMAAERMAHFNPANMVGIDDINKELGITDADLEGFDGVEFE